MTGNENQLLPEFRLPEKPVVHIKAGSFRQTLNFGELWQYRELLFFLVWRDVKIRYKQTVLGVAWAILQPVAATVIFTVFFAGFAKIPSDGVPYPLFAFAGFLPWTFFAAAVNTSGNSLVGSSHLITKVYFPRLIIPIAAVLSALPDFFIGFGILILMMFFYGATISVNLILLPVFLFLIVAFALAVGIFLSALNVKYRDIRFVVPFLLQIWMFATPIIYPTGLIPEKWRFLVAINPPAGIIEGFRAALFGQIIDWKIIGVSALITFIFFFCSIIVFRRMEKEFADII